MQSRTFTTFANRWHSRLRALSLMLLLGAGGLSASWVWAQAEEASTAAATPAVSQAAPAQVPTIAQEIAAQQALPVEAFGVREMFEQADALVKSVMLLLVFCSLLTWAVLFEKIFVFSRARRGNQRFLKAFRAGQLDVLSETADNSAMGRMWQVGQAELKHYRSMPAQPAETDRVNRLLQRMALTAGIVQERDLARMGSMMGVLATIGATAPFIGLFGTVWGILNSFASIATLKSASLAVVAPGIAEALLATALGLFAAIPAVMIFNKFARDINGFVGALDNFSAEMIASVSRQLDEGR
ncbi:biopolymer transport protein ExbB/biopolymer transport protein TolQ [Halopseudomonas sabulinigri]|uniref:Biopolymer transport protein ExbB/biopolymer transport protein TolQ n=1 Tax=Halopseudomonas sabulinigri TaxID=472181 RepID=A0A1H1M083_9GAMM|nr:MotA/TolQ/ExbB proton channel family protein [Halopseudomonas sabulinigri]SDR79459.1 biopolymer transport protein ExbB/biopolymer transport protein TolQ [Halopseudomonas sabulinigri]